MNAKPQRDASNKKRRLPRACDNCKRKKVKCDSDEMPGKRCSNCISSNLQCNHMEALNSLGSARGYVQKLEQRLERLERLFKRLLPDVNLDKEIESVVEDSKEQPPTQRSQFDDPVAAISHSINQLLVIPPQMRFFGKSSGLHFIPSIMKAKARYLSQIGRPLPSQMTIKKRLEFWDLPRLSQLPRDDCLLGYDFPEIDLMTSLVDLYFQYENSYLPLLHRPTFQRAISDFTYLYDQQCGSTVLLVCALGARHSTDERIYDYGHGEAGWKWFNQVMSARDGFEERDLTNLYELQIHVLSASYLQSIGLWESVWTQIGFAFRRAQDVGAHMRRDHPPNSNDELWKRAFWILFYFDVVLACLYGRPISLSYEDLDVDFPIDCDDEYWDHEDPQQNFCQPKDKPSKISFFISLLKLTEIATYVKRLIYPCRKSLIFAGFWQPSEEERLSTLDSVLDQWFQGMPTHLTWNPSEANEILLTQSGFLHLMFNYVRLLAHRPYMVGLVEDPVKMIQSTSVATCTQAAHSCLDIVSGLERVQYIRNLQCVSFVNSVTLTLLLIVFGKGKPTATDMMYIHASLGMMQSVERTIPSAGVFWDVISDLALSGLDQSRNMYPPQDSGRGSSSLKRPLEQPAPATSHIVPPSLLPDTYGGYPDTESQAFYPLGNPQDHATYGGNSHILPQDEYSNIHGYNIAEHPEFPQSLSLPPVPIWPQGNPDLPPESYIFP